MSSDIPSTAAGSERELLASGAGGDGAAVLVARPATPVGEIPAQPMPGWRLALSTFAENRLAVAVGEREVAHSEATSAL